VLYCKGEYNSIKDCLSKLSEQDEAKLQQIIKQFRKDGIRPLVYMKRDLSPEETRHLRNDFEMLNNQPESQMLELESLAVEWEKQLQIIGIVGLKEAE